jgi:hypothetical protein
VFEMAKRFDVLIAKFSQSRVVIEPWCSFCVCRNPELNPRVYSWPHTLNVFLRWQMPR